MVDKRSYIEYYENFTKYATELWKDKKRPDYKSDVWYNKDRNKISLEMIGDSAKGKRVLAQGAAMWPDAELLAQMGAQKVLRTDLVDSEGIDQLVDACHLPFDDGTWDFILCRELIEHVFDADALLEEARRVLTSNGLLFLETPNCYNVTPDGKEHRRGYSPDGLLLELKEHNFGVIAKKGNVPNIFKPLQTLSRLGDDIALKEFKKIARFVDKFEHSYYIGSLLFVLARKNGR